MNKETEDIQKNNQLSHQFSPSSREKAIGHQNDEPLSRTWEAHYTCGTLFAVGAGKPEGVSVIWTVSLCGLLRVFS